MDKESPVLMLLLPNAALSLQYSQHKRTNGLADGECGRRSVVAESMPRKDTHALVTSQAYAAWGSQGIRRATAKKKRSIK